MSAPETTPLRPDEHAGRAAGAFDWHAFAHRLSHVLPAQAPIRDFVHHNTLHGLQHLPFHEALATARRKLGVQPWWPAATYRGLYAEGRIDASDVAAAIDEICRIDSAPDPAGIVVAAADGKPALSRRQVIAAALIHDTDALSVARLDWELAQLGGQLDAAALPLWQACKKTNPTPLWPTPPDFPALVGRLGADWTLRDLLQTLSGEDLLDRIRAPLLRLAGAHLDQGLASWHHPARGEGFWATWRKAASDDVTWTLDLVPDARAEIDQLPEDAREAIERELAWRELPAERHADYLERLALEIPGWGGMFLWRDERPDYHDAHGINAAIADWLAVRLVLERFAAQELGHRLWHRAPTPSALAKYFANHPDELQVRLAVHHDGLPEAIATRAFALIHELGNGLPVAAGGWSELVGAWQSAAPEIAARQHQARSTWPLFRLAQALRLDAGELDAHAATLLEILHWLDADRRGHLWLCAYERHYRQRVFGALLANHGRSPQIENPPAQLVFCMDDREEGMRRHLEETAPELETFGAAAHYNVFFHWQGLYDSDSSALCPVVPVVVKPAHRIDELPRSGAESQHQARLNRLSAAESRRYSLFEGSRFGLLSAALATWVGALIAPPALWVRSFRPQRLAKPASPVGTRIEPLANPAAASQPATPEQPRTGFTPDEATDRVHAFLSNIGLTRRFAPLVVIVGHGSNSDNNPHLAAYDCGACSGRHSGPNGRLLAALANLPEVRTRLAGRGIAIPPGTFFLGAEHNTCDDSVSWYDLEDLPDAQRATQARLDLQLHVAGARHAEERCRRLYSAPVRPGTVKAQHHVDGRRHDFSQPRPELGHVTNACAFVGRRAMSREVFFDRRAFLISYDPNADDDGKVLERLLAANGPVGAGISLEYFFSTVDNDRFGCGSKITHNVTGLFGVMEGAASDLRTGLPKQMIEIHEPMRLLVVAEASTERLSAIYQRQPGLQELIGKRWLILAAKDPDAAQIHLFDPQSGWTPWVSDGWTPSTVARSVDWFGGEREPLPPALLSPAIPNPNAAS
ncbi:MAG TPA: DUF2309 domain-containing protein [Rhodocyclaceae bacterium]|nr:DUF2309 domain-containing protein [Rhodocyclaceae bacterium]